jgi:hypothetical protein
LLDESQIVRQHDAETAGDRLPQLGTDENFGLRGESPLDDSRDAGIAAQNENAHRATFRKVGR